MADVCHKFVFLAVAFLLFGNGVHQAGVEARNLHTLNLEVGIEFLQPSGLFDVAIENHHQHQHGKGDDGSGNDECHVQRVGVAQASIVVFGVLAELFRQLTVLADFAQQVLVEVAAQHIGGFLEGESRLLKHSRREIGVSQQCQIFVGEAVLVLQQIVDVGFHAFHIAVVIVAVGAYEQELCKVPLRRHVVVVPEFDEGIVYLGKFLVVGEDD